MIVCQEPGCGRAMKNLSGLHMHYRHKHNLSEGEWPDIRAKYGDITNETISKSSITQKPKVTEISSSKSDTPKTLETKEEIDSVSELTGDETERAELVDIEWDKDKPLEMMTHRTLPSKAMKLDPRIDFVFSYLKSNGLIPHDWKMGDFMNHYVLEHLRMKDGLNPSIIKTFGGNPNNREVIHLDEKFRDMNKPKSPDEELAELENTRIRALKMKEIERSLKGDKDTEKEAEHIFGGSFMKEMRDMQREMLQQKLAAKMVNQMLGEDEDGSTSSKKEIEKLKEELADAKQTGKIEAIKTMVENLRDNVLKQGSSKDITMKDLFQMVFLDRKKTDDLKDLVRTKDTEMMMQKFENSQKMVADELRRERNKPNIVSQIKDLKDTAEAFKAGGLLGKKEEKTSGELAKELIEGVVTSVSSSPAVQNYINKMAEGGQQTQYTPEQMAMLQQKQNPGNPTSNSNPVMINPNQGITPEQVSNMTREQIENLNPSQLSDDARKAIAFRSSPPVVEPDEDHEAENFAHLVDISDQKPRNVKG